ncbi:MAG: DUF1127 domain-containing protein, partial [Pseudomonadota bacterium]
SRIDLFGRLRAVFHDVAEALARYRTYRAIYWEMSMLSQHELDDLGLSRSQLADVAWASSKPE